MSSYWNKRYNRGLTSTGLNDSEKEMKFFEFFKHMMRGRLGDVKSILDYGCGDGRMVAYNTLRVPLELYHGVDISDVIISEQDFTFRDEPKVNFFTVSEFNKREQMEYDAIFLFNVLFHIMDNEEHKNVLKMVSKLAKKYIFIITWTKEPEYYDKSYQKYREWNVYDMALSINYDLICHQSYDEINSFLIYKRKEQ